MIQTLYPRSAKEIEKEIREIKAAGREIRKSQKSARAFLLKHGFITKDNKVGKKYR